MLNSTDKDLMVGLQESPLYTVMACTAKDRPDLYDKAIRIIAEGYLPLATFTPTIEEVIETLSKDGYDRNGLSDLVMAVVYDREGKEYVAGAVRLVYGHNQEESNSELPSIDAMRFFDVNWPNLEMNIGNDSIAEFGRFAIPATFRTDEMKNLDVTRDILRAMFGKAQYLLERKKIKYLYAIMPRYVVNLITKIGLQLQELHSTRIFNDANQALYDRYDRYWSNNPKVFQFTNWDNWRSS